MSFSTNTNWASSQAALKMPKLCLNWNEWKYGGNTWSGHKATMSGSRRSPRQRHHIISKWARKFLRRRHRCITVISHFPNVTKFKVSWISAAQQIFLKNASPFIAKIYTEQLYWSDSKWHGPVLRPHRGDLYWFRLRVYSNKEQVVEMKSAMFSCLCRIEVSSIGNGKWHIGAKSYW